MKVLIDRLTESPSVQRFDADAAWWQELVSRVPELGESPADPLQFELRAHRMGADLYLEGTATGALSLGCGRCLARYRQPVRESFRLVLEPAGPRAPADPERARDLARTGVCLGDELEAGWFQGSEIDLGPFLHEVITLALPFQPVCREECRGLCPRCGIDRNVETCDCEASSGASPFAVLGRLRGAPPQGEE